MGPVHVLGAYSRFRVDDWAAVARWRRTTLVSYSDRCRALLNAIAVAFEQYSVALDGLKSVVLSIVLGTFRVEY